MRSVRSTKHLFLLVSGKALNALAARGKSGMTDVLQYAAYDHLHPF